MFFTFSRFCWELSEVLHEHLGPLNEPSASSARIPVSPRMPPVPADPIIAGDGPVADPVARKRDAAERVAAFRWRPAPPKVRKFEVDVPRRSSCSRDFLIIVKERYIYIHIYIHFGKPFFLAKSALFGGRGFF